MRKVLLSLAALAIATPAFAGENYNKVVKPGDKAPVFSGIPAYTPGGEQTSLTLSDVKEDVVVLVFLANHCPAVVGCEDRLNEFTSEYKDKGVRVVGLCVNDIEEDKLPAILKRVTDKNDKKINYDYGYDESQAVGRAYGATKTPYFFVLDKDRTIRYLGAFDDNADEAKVTKHYVKDAVDALLAGKAPAVEETRAKGCGVKYNN
ncbi:thioredoxin family protein [Planctomyces sp. SH-PL62]|uniref:thioredoxin family protein n=1 Tax=Planctomyces sp. SH-PL62 TaxID=1636152 RepID=UPI00078CB48B|nr:thioredoxin family protein [Planctomyces sp. SH-PL62]AMV37041.1 thiol-disulfide oxidoreductase [Planctomyces sp. SH-PL62]